jgi:hypothetical protein
MANRPLGQPSSPNSVPNSEPINHGLALANLFLPPEQQKAKSSREEDAKEDLGERWENICTSVPAEPQLAFGPKLSDAMANLGRRYAI